MTVSNSFPLHRSIVLTHYVYYGSVARQAVIREQLFRSFSCHRLMPSLVDISAIHAETLFRPMALPFIMQDVGRRGTKQVRYLFRHTLLCRLLLLCCIQRSKPVRVHP